MSLVPITEAARILGVSTDTIARRIKKKTIFARRDNAGRWLVDPATAKSVDSSRAVASSAPPQATAIAAATAELDRAGPVSLYDVRLLLGEQSERLERQHKEAVAALQVSHRSTIDLLVERIDGAECRAESAEARAAVVEDKLVQVLDRLLERHDRPWWSRWFGQSKRSDS